MKQAFKFFILLLAVVVVSAGTTAAFHLLPIATNLGPSDVKYSDFLAVTLTGLGLMLTVLGFFIAALGVIGWTTFESKLRDNSLSYLASELSKDGNLRREFEQILTKLSFQGVEPEEKEVETGSANSAPESPYND